MEVTLPIEHQVAILSVVKRLDARVRLVAKRDWSASDDKLLKQLWRKRTTHYIAYRLGRCRRTVKTRALALNLEKGEQRHAA